MGGQHSTAQHSQGITHLSEEDAAFLLRDDVRTLLEEHIGCDPLGFSMSAAVSGFTAPQRTAMGNQLKYLQRARAKLPRYYAARCIIPPLAFEQCSSEESAATKRYRGEFCIDLTCGMGVDSLNFSASFGRVTAIECDPALAGITRNNLALLGAGNVEVINTTAEDFLASYEGPMADLAYIDPARRSDDGRRLFLPHECTPNVIGLMPRLKQVARRIVIKLSPLFDVNEAFRLFGPGITVEVVSSHNECKEVVVDIDNEAPGQDDMIKVTSASAGRSLAFPRQAGSQDNVPDDFAGKAHAPLSPTGPDRIAANGMLPYKYLLVPDVSLYKARLLKRYLSGSGRLVPSETGFVLSGDIPDNFMGEAYLIGSAAPYKPKAIKQSLAKEGIRRLNILKKDFPVPTERIASALGIAQGGTGTAAFTEIGGDKFVLFLQRVERQQP